MNRILVSYAPLMWRDYVMTRGGAMAIVAAVFIGPMLLGFAQNPDMTPDQMRRGAVGIIIAVTPFLTLIATYGLIGQDFRLGFFRPMFAKPISVPWYYAMQFACAAVTFWLVQALILIGLAAFGINAWDPAVWLEMSLRFVLLGTLVFAISRVTRLDWIFAMLVFSLAAPLRLAYPVGESLRGWLINVLFPPTQLFDLESGARAPGQMSALITSAGPEWGSVSWIAGYALICLLIGLLAARHIPLASVQ